ncbi:MAG: HPF/RaiA family ribosome-associated protein [Fulvivirga sp.]
MKTEIEFVDIARNNELEGQINKEISKLNTRYIWLTHAIVYLKLDKGIDKDHVVELEFRMPGNPIFVKEKASKFSFAITKAFNVMHRQLEKRKVQLYQH